jgi:hypothetical protein
MALQYATACRASPLRVAFVSCINGWLPVALLNGWLSCLVSTGGFRLPLLDASVQIWYELFLLQALDSSLAYKYT